MAARRSGIMMVACMAAISGCATPVEKPPLQTSNPSAAATASDTADIGNNRTRATASAGPLRVAGVILPTALAGSISAAMAKAYSNNPDLNAARAGLRATNEGVPIAKAGYRPRVAATVDATATRLDNRNYTQPLAYQNGAISLVVTQTVFDGFQTYNNVRAAEATAFSGLETLKEKEISILLAAAQAYANIARDQQIVSLRRQNLIFIRQQLSATQMRQNVGEATRTDIAQAEAQLAQSQSLLLNAQAQLKASEAVYLQIVGDAPVAIKSAPPIPVPYAASLQGALSYGLDNNPAIASAWHNVTAADYRVKSAEGTLLPGVVLQGALTRNLTNYPGSDDGTGNSASVTARLEIPIYQGGVEYGQIRRAKELLTEQQILVDSERASVRQTIQTAYAQRDAAIASTAAIKTQISAANRALSGVIEERKIGQRTTLDVLNAQQSVLIAKEGLVNAERDATVASYTLSAAMGALSLGLEGAGSQSAVKHYSDGKDRWIGTDIAAVH